MPRPKSDIDVRIVRAARKRFLAEGVDGAALRQIARDAGTSIGMIYYYFPTKDDLFLAVVEEVYERLVADLATALTRDASFEARIERLYRRVGAMSKTEVDVIRLVIREALVSSSRLERLIERFKRGHIALVLRAVADGFGDGSLRLHFHPGVLVMSTMALGFGPQLVRRLGAGRLPFDDLPEGDDFARQLVGVLLGGIGSRNAEIPARPSPSHPPDPQESPQ